MRTFWYIALLYAMLGLLNIARKWPFLIDAKKIAIFAILGKPSNAYRNAIYQNVRMKKILKILKI